jgi:hypothetical protein
MRIHHRARKSNLPDKLICLYDLTGLIRRGHTVGMNKPIRRDRDGTGIGVESIDLVLQTRSRTEILHISINRVCEINVFIFRVNGYIVQGVKLATEVIVQEN